MSPRAPSPSRPAPERVPLVFALPRFASMIPPLPALERGKIVLGRFANGELHAHVQTAVGGRDCFVLGTAAPPAEHLARLLLACHTLAQNGAASVHALLPYLAYARQDREERGRSLGVAWLGRLLAASGVTDVTTIDIHSECARALIDLPVRSLSPAPLFAAALADRGVGAVVVAPDGGAIERARTLAEALELDTPVAWLDKVRRPGGVVHRRVVGELAPRAIVVDDILDTGETLVSCCEQLRSRGVERLQIAVTHGLFTGRRWRMLPRLGVHAIHVTDSVPAARRHASRVVRIHSVARLIEAAVVEPRAELAAARGPAVPAAAIRRGSREALERQ